MEISEILIRASATIAGGAVGYLYYRFIGCKSGVCPLTSTPTGSIFLGALMMFALSANF